MQPALFVEVLNAARCRTLVLLALLAACATQEALERAHPTGPAPATGPIPMVDPPEPGVQVLFRGVRAGVEQRIDERYSLQADCASTRAIEFRVVAPPAHGQLTSRPAQVLPSFNKDNPRFACNQTPVSALQVYYAPAAGYAGADDARAQVLYGDGQLITIHYRISVLADDTRADALPYQVFSYNLRGARTGTEQSIDKFYLVPADCSSVLPFGQILEPPAHGAVRLIEGTGSANFDANAASAVCNGRPVKALVLNYRSEPGYVGTDGFRAAVVFPGGSFRSAKYEVRVLGEVPGPDAAAAPPPPVTGCANYYPIVSRRRGEQGTTTLLIYVAEGGAKDVRVLTSSGFPALDEAAITCVSAFGGAFIPSQVDGKTVSGWQKLPVRWALTGPVAPVIVRH